MVWRLFFPCNGVRLLISTRGLTEKLPCGIRLCVNRCTSSPLGDMSVCLRESTCQDSPDPCLFCDTLDESYVLLDSCLTLKKRETCIACLSSWAPSSLLWPSWFFLGPSWIFFVCVTLTVLRNPHCLEPTGLGGLVVWRLLGSCGFGKGSSRTSSALFVTLHSQEDAFWARDLLLLVLTLVRAEGVSV